MKAFKIIIVLIVSLIIIIGITFGSYVFYRHNLKYDKADSFYENLAVVEKYDLFFKEKKYGYINKSDSIIIRIIYEEAHPFSEGLAVVGIKDGYGNKYGCVDTTGNMVVSPVYDRIIDFSSGMALVYNGSKWGFINKKGELVIPFLYEQANSFKGEYTLVSREESGGLFKINKKGEDQTYVELFKSLKGQ